jgi:hypothetical protein
MSPEPFYLTDIASCHRIGPEKKVYACTGSGIWLQSSLVVIASNKGHAKRLALKALGEAGVRDPQVWDVEEITTDGAHVLDNGDY